MSQEMKAQFLKMLANATIAKAAKTDEEAVMRLRFNPYYIIQNGLNVETTKKVGARR
jgi:hypothetical protein